MSRGREREDGDAGRPRSRRGLLAAAAAGGLGVIAGETISRAVPAMADNGQPVLQGTDNGTPTRRTAVRTKHETGVLADPNTSGRGSLGVFGAGQDFGVRGEGGSGLGVGVAGVGGSTGGAGVAGAGGAPGGIGVAGDGGPGDGVGVVGAGSGFREGVSGVGGSAGGTGVVGTGVGFGSGVHGIGGASGGVGVFAEGAGNGPGLGASGGTGGGIGVLANGFGAAAGVLAIGGPSHGTGVEGHGGFTGGTGVAGTGGGAGGHGVTGRAVSPAGAGVLAENTAGGNALQVTGKATFSRSGLLTVAAGSSSATKTGVALTPASLVLATLQQDRPGVWIRSAVPNVTESSFTVHLNRPVPASTSVAWFVVN